MSNSDWVETTVGDVVVESFSGPSPTCDERNTEGEEWGVLKTTCATVERGWDWTKHKVLPKSFWGNERSLIRTGDTVITKAGPRHRVAVPAYVDFVPPHILVSGKMVGLRPNPAAIHPRFLALALSDVRTQTFIDARTTGMAESQVNFENATLLEAPLFLPSLAEQQAIADALSDTDALVESLDALIAKKCDMKQAAMQQLLTGRSRLPGFADEWQELRVGDFCEIVMGQSPESHFYNADGHGLPLIQGNADITNRRTVERVWTLRAPKRANYGDVLLTVRAPVGAVARASGKVCLGRGVCAVRPSRVTTDFLFHALVFGEPEWSALEQGSTFTAANSRDVAEFVLCVPRNEAEQAAIAEVLADMDDEIEALVAQRDKMRLVKQGMVQELLSGRVRLV